MLLRKFRARQLRFWGIYIVFMLALAILFRVLIPEESVVSNIFFGLTLFMALIGMLTLLSKRSVKTYLRTVETMSEEEETRMCEEYNTGFRLNKAALTENHLVDCSFSSLSAIPYDRIIWIYPYTQATRYMFITISRVYFLYIITDDKKTRIAIQYKKKQKNLVDEFMAKIAAKNPNVILGYDARLEQMLRKDFDGLVRWSRSNQQAG